MMKASDNPPICYPPEQNFTTVRGELVGGPYAQPQ